MSRTEHWKLGLFVSLGLAVAVFMLFWLGMARFRREAIFAVTYFDESVQGLDVGSPVKFRGVTLGTVSSITIAPDQRHVQIDMQIFTEELQRMGLAADTPMNPEVRVQLASAGITGVKFLQVDFFEVARHPVMELPFEPGSNYIPSVPSTLKGLEEALNVFLDKLPLYGDRIKKVLEEGRETLAQIRKVATMLEDEQGPVQQLVRRVDSAVGTLEGAIKDAELGHTAKSLRASAASVGDAAGNLSKTSVSVGKTSSQVGALSDDLGDAVRGLQEALEAARALLSELNHDPSAVLRGKRANDAPRTETTR